MDAKVAVIAGGAGGVGEGIVKSLLKSDFTVVVPTRTENKAESLRQYVSDVKTGKLITHIGAIDNEISAEEFKNYLYKEFAQINLAVASLGGWHQGYPVYSYPINAWHRVLNDNLTAHFFAIKTLVPLLNPISGHYVHINGFSADEQYPMAGPVSMAAAAQKSLILTLAKELEKSGIRVYELILGPMKTRDRLKHSSGKPEWYYPEEVGDYIIQLLQSNVYDKPLHYLLSK